MSGTCRIATISACLPLGSRRTLLAQARPHPTKHPVGHLRGHHPAPGRHTHTAGWRRARALSRH
eukprot:905307-Prymnesium_polylepis.1